MGTIHLYVKMELPVICHVMKFCQLIQIGFLASPRSSYYWQNENPVALNVCCRKFTPEGASCSVGGSGILFGAGLWGEDSRARKGVLHSPCSSPACALFTCSFLRPDISTFPLFSRYSAHTGFRFLFLRKALLKNNPPRIILIVFPFPKLFRYVLQEAFGLAFSHMLLSRTVLWVINFDSTVRLIGPEGEQASEPTLSLKKGVNKH